MLLYGYYVLKIKGSEIINSTLKVYFSKNLFSESKFYSTLYLLITTTLAANEPPFIDDGIFESITPLNYSLGCRNYQNDQSLRKFDSHVLFLNLGLQ